MSFDAHCLYIYAHVASTCVTIFSACVNCYITWLNTSLVCVIGFSNTCMFFYTFLDILFLTVFRYGSYTQQCSSARTHVHSHHNATYIIFTGCGMCECQRISKIFDFLLFVISFLIIQIFIIVWKRTLHLYQGFIIQKYMQ